MAGWCWRWCINDDEDIVLYDVELDWDAYWEHFKDKHGDPVRVGGRLLFPDCWGYGLDVQGPEFPPMAFRDATEEGADLHNARVARVRIKLMKLYWTTVRDQIKLRRDAMQSLVMELKKVQAERDCKLQYVPRDVETGLPMRGEDGKRLMAELDIDFLERNKLASLDADLKQCNETLDSLTPKVKEQTDGQDNHAERRQSPAIEEQVA